MSRHVKRLKAVRGPGWMARKVQLQVTASQGHEHMSVGLTKGETGRALIRGEDGRTGPQVQCASPHQGGRSAGRLNKARLKGAWAFKTATRAYEKAEGSDCGAGDIPTAQQLPCAFCLAVFLWAELGQPPGWCVDGLGRGDLRAWRAKVGSVRRLLGGRASQGVGGAVCLGTERGPGVGGWELKRSP